VSYLLLDRNTNWRIFYLGSMLKKKFEHYNCYDSVTLVYVAFKSFGKQLEASTGSETDGSAFKSLLLESDHMEVG
jgi:hypothetical protein